MMAADTSKASNENGLQAQLGKLIDALDLDDSQKRFLHQRWLDQVVWMDNRAGRAQKTTATFVSLPLAVGYSSQPW